MSLSFQLLSARSKALPQAPSQRERGNGCGERAPSLGSWTPSPATRGETEVGSGKWELTWTLTPLIPFAAQVRSSPPKKSLALVGSPHPGAPQITPLGSGCQRDVLGGAGRAALHHSLCSLLPVSPPPLGFERQNSPGIQVGGGRICQKILLRRSKTLHQTHR